ncbi:MAG: protein adenylyltransferase SelO family protein, partial [Terriglobia bacterium]
MNLENDYSRLPNTLYTRLDPTPVVNPKLIELNHSLADELGLKLELSDSGRLAQIFSGNDRLPGSQPIALAYAGHQFGSFVPQLGDGRALLLGEARDRHGVLKDIQLKGAGRTVYSRGGDGRAALGPV